MRAISSVDPLREALEHRVRLAEKREIDGSRKSGCVRARITAGRDGPLVSTPDQSREAGLREAASQGGVQPQQLRWEVPDRGRQCLVVPACLVVREGEEIPKKGNTGGHVPRTFQFLDGSRVLTRDEKEAAQKPSPGPVPRVEIGSATHLRDSLRRAALPQEEPRGQDMERAVAGAVGEPSLDEHARRVPLVLTQVDVREQLVGTSVRGVEGECPLRHPAEGLHVSISPFSLRTTPDHILLEGLKKLAARDAELEADLLVHLGEVDARGLALARGFRSLHAYCVEVLHFSESVAFHRITAARAVRRFPEILERIRSGELHLSGLRLLVPHLTPESCEALLDLARHQSKRVIEEKLADRAPKPDVPAQVRRLPEPSTPAKPLALDAPPPVPTPTPSPAPPVPKPEVAASSPEPLGHSRYKVQFTAGPETHAKLVEAQALLRHQIPDGDLGRIFDRALDALLREARRAKFGEVEHPREARTSGSPATRHIPAAIRRAVAVRDGERCAFVAPDGRRCDARDALEFHHRVPFARSHRHRESELTLRCRAHNGQAAREDFGADYMSRFLRERTSTVTRPGASDRAEESRRDTRARDHPIGP